MCSYKTNGHLLTHKPLAMKDASSIYIIIPDLCFQQEIFRKHKFLEAKRTRVLQGWCDFSLDLVFKYYIKQKNQRGPRVPQYINKELGVCITLHQYSK